MRNQGWVTEFNMNLLVHWMCTKVLLKCWSKQWSSRMLYTTVQNTCKITKRRKIITSCINTTDIEDIKRSTSYNLKDILKCSTIPCENTPCCTFWRWNDTYVSRNAQASCRLVPSYILHRHIHPFGISNPKFYCYINSVIQFFFRFWRQSVIISSLIPVRKVPYLNVYLKQHIVHPVLQMWMPSNFDWYNMMHSRVDKFTRIVRSVSWC